MSEGESISRVVDASRALAAAGQSNFIWGHVALRDPQGRGAWMKAAGWGFEEIEPSRVVLVSPTGEVLAGDGRRHIEFPIHTEVLAAREDVGAVVHTHSPSATAFASFGVPLRPISHDGVHFTDPDIPRFPEGGNLIRTAALGRGLADCIGDNHGCLLPQHGLVTVGRDESEAVMKAVFLDRACELQLTAMAAGGPALWSDPDEVRSKRAEVWTPDQLRAGYDYLCRRASASFLTQPG